LIRATRALAEQSGKPIPESELAALPTMQMDDDGRFVLDRTVGLVRELVVNRRISAGKDSVSIAGRFDWCASRGADALVRGVRQAGHYD
jgi:hypothetical protein